jgi:hypothetical protein
MKILKKRLKPKADLLDLPKTKEVLPTDITPNFSPKLSEFIRECGFRLGASLTRFLRDRYKECFQEEMPSGIAYDLIRAKIGYHLLVQAHHLQRYMVPEIIQSRYESALKFSRKGLSVAFSVEKQDTRAPNHSKQIENYNRKKEAVMVTEKKTAAPVVEEEEAVEAPKKKVVKKAAAPAPKVVKEKKEKGPSVAATWIEIFASSTGKRQTDDMLAQKMQKAFPDKKKYTVNDVAAYRRVYNKGGLPGQNAAPKVKAERYEPKSK